MALVRGARPRDGGLPIAASARRGGAVPSEALSVALDSGITDAPRDTFDAADADDHALHFRAAEGPAPTPAAACAPFIAHCSTASCPCPVASVVIAPTTAKHPFAEAKTLAVDGAIHPAFRLAAGWFVGPFEGLEFHGAQPSMGNKTTWATVRVLGVRVEDVVPGGEPELVFRFASQLDMAYGGAMGGAPMPRSPIVQNEVLVVCTTAGTKPSCFSLIGEAVAFSTKVPPLRFPSVSPTMEVTLPHVLSIDGTDGTDWRDGTFVLILP